MGGTVQYSGWDLAKAITHVPKICGYNGEGVECMEFCHLEMFVTYGGDYLSQYQIRLSVQILQGSLAHF